MIAIDQFENLKQIYRKHGSILVAFDFDDTIFPYNQSHDVEPIFQLALRCNNSNKCVVMLFTCREGERLAEAVDYCNSRGLHFYYINENANPLFTSRKPHFNILLDDKAGLPYTYETLLKFMDWVEAQDG
jgi:hypothetical protein